ncbi:uncharacterized protein CEXT_687381 [Caerostris extrusa]|uniref:LRRCT domain-containing protein n=1 Tax=Caerostris extrusa TaxID=172846 RepID=A0AAV4V5G7_CAEEX|nr:uncharacterized protein CEXT_687381 [Caerostris extrusa]
MSDWDWTLFRNLKKLTTLDIVGVNLESLEDLETINITSIIKIAFSHNRISFIHPSAFSNFKELRLLSLDNNFISVIKRSMLPNPALELTDLDLSYNEIEDLPSDIFSNMPQLEYLSIGFNKILVLEEKTFSPVWEKLQAFSAFGNDLRCDCRLTWILEKMYPRDLRAVCSQPPEAKGKNLRDLASKDLWCFL